MEIGLCNLFEFWVLLFEIYSSMIFTYLASIFLTQLLNPALVDFEHTVALKQSLQQRGVYAEAPVRVNQANIGPILTSRSAVVIDAASRKVLWSKNLHKRYPIASISKLMTVLVFLDTDPDLTSTYTMLPADMTVGGHLYIDAGETVYERDLIYSALIASDNNAANALVRASGLSREEFISRMNKKAVEIGMLNSHFIEPTGLEYANISSAQDIALLLEEALNNEVIADAVSREQFTFTAVNGPTHTVGTTNILLDSYLDVIGGKTGFNNEAQYNLVIAVNGEEGQRLLVGVLGSETINSRYQEAKILADWALTNYTWRVENPK